MASLRQSALLALSSADIADKCQRVAALPLPLATEDDNSDLAAEAASLNLPGLPKNLQLVPSKAVKQRGFASIEARAHLIHALAHIEFNAINLALDIIWRFPAAPSLFYQQWRQVAQEEAYHFSLLQQRLGALGQSYGDFPAHAGLWEMADKTRHDVIARLAMVPCTLEARGLDVTPALQQKLRQVKDEATAQILDIILRDEIGHVAIGYHWYHYFCDERGVDPHQTYRQLAMTHHAPAAKPPINFTARRAAGFVDADWPVFCPD